MSFLLVAPLWRFACNDLWQANRLATPTRTRTSPRPIGTMVTYSSSEGSTTSRQETRPPTITATSTASIGVQGDAAPTIKPSVVVDGSSNTTPRPSPSPLAAKTASPDKNGKQQAGKAAPVALVSTGVSASDAPPPAGGSSVSAETVGTATEEVLMGGSTVVVGTTRKSSRGSGVQVESRPMLVEASDGGSPATQDGDGGVIPSAATVAAGDEKGPQIRERSVGGNTDPNDNEHAAKQPLPTAEPNKSPSIDVAAAKTAIATTSAPVPTDQNSSDTMQGQKVGEEIGNAVDLEGPLDSDDGVEEVSENAPNMVTKVESNGEDGGKRDAQLSVPDADVQEVWEKEADGSTLMGRGEHQGESGTKTKEKEEQGEREKELDQQLQERREEDGGGGGSERRSTDTGWSSSPETDATSTTSGAVVEDANVKSVGRDRFESLDGETLLGKLLDERAPSAVFEDDHQKLLQKLMRVRDDERVSGMTSCRDDSSRTIHAVVLHFDRVM